MDRWVELPMHDLSTRPSHDGGDERSHDMPQSSYESPHNTSIPAPRANIDTQDETSRAPAPVTTSSVPNQPVHTEQENPPEVADTRELLNKSQPSFKLNRTQRFAQWCTEHWVFELLASFWSAACLAAIIIVLVLRADRPLPDWPFNITINALISTLSTISRSALLVSVTATIGQRKWARLSRGVHPLSDLEVFDDAARGPWGSMNLLWSVGVTDLAFLGATITILSLAQDPFIQQITSFESAPIPVGTSSLPSRIIFETGVNSSRDGSFFRNAWTIIPNIIRPMVTQGFYFDGNLSDAFSRNGLQLQPKSKGGNVTFGISESLAVCTQCANITNFLQGPKQCDPTNDEDQCDVKNQWRWDLPNSATTSWTTLGDRSTCVLAASDKEYPLVLNTTDRLTILNLTVIAPDWELYSEDPPDGKGGKDRVKCVLTHSTPQGLPGVAQECMLYWCVNKYETTLNGGVLHEKVISSFSQASREKDTRYFSFKPPGSNSSLPRANSMDYGDYPQGVLNGTYFVNVDTNNLMATEYFQPFLTGSIVTLNVFNRGAGITANPSLNRIYSKVAYDPITNLTRLEMDGLFEGMAQGLTTVVRSPDITHSENDALVSIDGIETAMEVFVRVNWAWMALPLLLQVASLIFIVSTVMRNRTLRIPAWKSSALAVFFFGTRMANEIEHDGIERWADMLYVAGDHRPVIREKKDM